ncbi:hypothetical protein CI111_02890 [Fusobacterium animalis]|uniref:Uncharacterized protein n=1 Tax=Fusobacterium animalis TaxID=76859 RepID=A0A2G9FN51_9FUSO|nr:hypothetical protein [Fusobacterium animalis]PIM93097.1 hypothetical protein CI114_02770 [Fusobacterium animalis]PIM94271.1 hypothetical protein CI111_02890 [Fusobacterium animalis]
MNKIIQLNVTLPYYELMFSIEKGTSQMDSMNIKYGEKVEEIKESINIDGGYDYTVVMENGKNIVFKDSQPGLVIIYER